MVAEQGLLEFHWRECLITKVISWQKSYRICFISHGEGADAICTTGRKPGLLTYSNHWDVTSQQRAWLGCFSQSDILRQAPRVCIRVVKETNIQLAGELQPRALGTSRMTDYKPSAWQLVLRAGSFRFASTSLNHKVIIKSQQEQSPTTSAPGLSFSMQTSCWYWNVGLAYLMMLTDAWLGF